MIENSPNEVKESVKYACTVTLKPRMYQYKAEQQYDISYPEMVKQLSCMGVTKMTIIAELTQNFNIHFHLTVVFPLKGDNVMKRFVDAFRKSTMFGFVKIVQIDDENKWIEYIGKSFYETQYASGRRPIIKDDFDYWPPELYIKYGTEW